MLTVGTKSVYSRKVTKSMVAAFCRLNGDMNGIHRTVEEAHRAGFDGIVVQGMLCASFGAAAMWKLGGEGTLLGEWQKIRFIRPVLVGDTVTVEVSVFDVFPPTKSGRNRYLVEAVFKNQRGEDVIETTQGMMFVPPIGGASRNGDGWK